MTITVTSFKGEVGKTTTAVHMACYLQGKAPTLLVDGDPNRAVTEWTAQVIMHIETGQNYLIITMPKVLQRLCVDTQNP